MGNAARNAGRERRRNDVERERLDAAQAAAEADHPLHRLVNAPTPLARLYAISEARGWLSELEAQEVGELRAVGVSWAQLGRALGVSGQAVQKRYASQLDA